MELTRELEHAEAGAAVGCVEAAKSGRRDVEYAVETIGVGYAIYCGADSPVTQAVGVEIRVAAEEEIDRVARGIRDAVHAGEI